MNPQLLTRVIHINGIGMTFTNQVDDFSYLAKDVFNARCDEIEVKARNGTLEFNNRKDVITVNTQPRAAMQVILEDTVTRGKLPAVDSFAKTLPQGSRVRVTVEVLGLGG